MFLLLLLLLARPSGARWSVWASSHDGTRLVGTQFAFWSSEDPEVCLCMCPCRPSASFAVVSPSSWRSSNIPVMGFMSFFSPPGYAFIPSWRQRQGFPREFYKCLSGGTAGTSLFPSAHKLSSERRQSSTWWESWRSFWSALGCDSQCWSGMRQIDRNECIWAKSKRFGVQHLSGNIYLIVTI